MLVQTFLLNGGLYQMMSLPVFSPRVWSLGWNVWRKCEEVLVTAVVEGFLIEWCCFVVWDLGQSTVNGLWNVPDNAWRVVRCFVDVEWNVVRPVEWHMCSSTQTERHLKEVNDFLLASMVILRPCLPKISQGFFLTSSVWWGKALVMPRPSSLYRPKL